MLKQIGRLDFEKIGFWVANIIKNSAPDAIRADLIPALSYHPSPVGPEHQRKYKEVLRLGKELISSGKVAAFVVAGGQGTRLGFDGPKGDFPISPVNNKTLFQIFADSVAAASKKYQADYPWYVTTSPLNHDETIEIFRSNNYYGLNEKKRLFLLTGNIVQIQS